EGPGEVADKALDLPVHEVPEGCRFPFSVGCGHLEDPQVDGIATKSRVGNEVLLRAGLDGQDRTVPTDAKVGEAQVAVLRRQPDGAWLLVLDDPHGAHLLDAGSPE
ncbi:MAG: hypothetical protein R3B72_32670, partial [Polyangiaceae bacterium]